MGADRPSAPSAAVCRRGAVSPWFLGSCWLLLSLAALPGVVMGQDGSSSGNAAVPYRRIFFYQDEAARLVPSHFRAVDVEDLESLLVQPSAVAPPGEGQPRLQGAEYWASFDDGTLHSDQSHLEVSYRDDAPGELDLGEVNLALRDTGKDSSDLQPPYLYTARDGTLRAAVSRDCKIPFAWTLGEQRIEPGIRRFVLQIPPCAAAPLYLDVPRSFRLFGTNGIAIELAGPPSGASNEAMESSRRWYKVEAGGLHHLTLDLAAESSVTEEIVVPIRQRSTAFRVGPAGIQWTTQMTLERLEGRTLPPLNVGSTRVTSVRIDGQPVPWKETSSTADAEQRRIEITPPRELDERLRSVTTNVAVTGTAPLVAGQLFMLPYPQWEDCFVAMMAPNVQTQLTMDRDLTLARLEFPADWDAKSVEVSDNGEVTYQIRGPAHSPTRPRIELLRRQTTMTAEAALRLDVATTQIGARWNGRIAFGDEGPRPVQIQLEPQWRIDSVLLPHSQRVIEVPAEIGRRRTLTIWPEPDDLEEEENALQLRVTGHRLSSSFQPASQRGVSQIPATWFVRVRDCRTETVAAVHPPVGWRWPGESVIRSQTLSNEDLSDAMRSMLGPLNAKTLLFALPEDSTATLLLERPLPVVEADVTLALTRDGAFVTETLTVNLRTPGNAFSEVRVRTGPANGRPPLSWSLAGSATQTGPLASLDEGTNRFRDDETWVITPPVHRGGELGLVGRRRYRVDASQVIDLPTVAQAVTQQSSAGIAANQDTSVLIGRNLHVQETSGPVQRVPAARDDASGWRRLRYDPSEPASIVLTQHEQNPSPNVIWEERVHAYASARWGDTIVAEYQTDGRRPLRIEHDGAMTLEEASTSGRPFVLSEIVTDRNAVVIPASMEKQHLRLQFRRPIEEGGLLRRWEPPLLQADGVVLRSQWIVHPVADTVIPEWERGWIAADVARSVAMDTKQRNEGIDVSASSADVWLIANEGFWGVGTALALLTFAAAWWISRSRPSALLVAMMAAGCIAIWWPRTAFAVTGFVLLPIIAGGLLELAIRRLATFTGEANVKTRREAGSTQYSATQQASVIFVFCGLSAMAAGASAQQVSGDTPETTPPAAEATSTDAEPEGETTSPAAYPVMIPVNEEQQPSGSTVYIPEALYQALFLRSAVDRESSDTRFRRAEYRVRISGAGMGPDMQSARVDADFMIQCDRPGQELQLPFSPSKVRSTEVVFDGVARTVRWIPSGEEISIMLPRAGLNQLRVSLAPEVAPAESDVFTLAMQIPPVLESKLTLDSDAPLQSVDAIPCNGVAQLDASGDRFSADLGAVDQLSLRWQLRRELDFAATPPLIRRWLVHVGAQKVVTECEMDLSALVTAVDDEVQLDVYPDSPAKVTSRGWTHVDQKPIDAMRSRLTVRASEYPPRPLRLMWDNDVESLDREAGGEGQSRLYTPPNVRPVRSVPMGRSFIAVDADPRFQVRVDANAAAEIENDRFLAGWSPGIDLIDQAYVTQSGPPQLTLFRPPSIPWRAEEHQRLHISMQTSRAEGQLALHYQADVVPGDRSVGPMRISLPAAMQVQRLELDGRPVVSTTRRIDGVLELALPDPTPRQAFRLQLRAWMPLPSHQQFSPPRAVLSPVDVSTGSYSMTRGNNVVIQQREPTGLPESPITIPNATRLSEGIVPRWSWQLEASQLPPRPVLPGSFEVAANPTEVRATQITDLYWQDGRWSVETVFDIQPVQGRIDFLAFELPTRWSDELEISPAISWSVQPAAEPTKRLVRVLPENPSSSHQQIRIRSRLRSSDSGQVSVPDVRLLGDGTRRRFIGMPPQLTSDPIRWETNGARRVDRPKVFQNVKGIDANQLVYEVSGNWFAKLVSVMATRRQATATVLDVQLFPQQDESVLAICRWDMLPADRTEVQVRMPRGAAALGSWSAGLQAPATREGDLLTVPLNLSRLGQSVELLVRLSPQESDEDWTLPRLVDVPVQSTWLARYQQTPAPDRLAEPLATGLQIPWPALRDSLSATADEVQTQWQVRTSEARGLALGKSVAEILDGSLDSLAQRPNDEIAAWLLPWLERAQRVLPIPAASDSADAPPAAVAAGDEEASAQPQGAQPEDEEIDKAAEALSERLENFTSSVLGTTDLTSFGSSSARHRFSMASEDWTTGFVATHPGQADSVPAIFVHEESQPIWWHVDRLAAVLGLLMVGLVTWKLGGPGPQLVSSPAFWLFLVGVAGLLLAPLPVAIAICTIALLSPWFPAARRARQR